MRPSSLWSSLISSPMNVIIGVRDKFRSGGGGGLKSLARFFYSTACTDMFCPNMATWKKEIKSRGLQPPQPHGPYAYEGYTPLPMFYPGILRHIDILHILVAKSNMCMDSQKAWTNTLVTLSYTPSPLFGISRIQAEPAGFKNFQNSRHIPEEFQTIVTLEAD